MGIFSFFASSFMDGWRNGQQCTSLITPAEAPAQYDDLPPPPNTSSGDFENRLLRARTEPLSILRRQFMGERCVSANVRNEQTDSTYHVTLESCDCDDFKKHGRPCKHMIYFALKTGDFFRYEKPLPAPPPKYIGGNFIPFYGRYYSGPPTGIGYKNLYPYRIVGRVYGTSEKTGRPTNRKKVIVVNARSPEDAQAAADAAGVSPPYAEISMMDISPSYNQLSYLHAVGIPFPFFVTSDDVSALLTRHQLEQDDLCPRGLLDMATARRVDVSYFASPQSVVSQIWYCAPPGERAALFCYAVFCRETGCEIGCAPIPHDDITFTSFSVKNKQALTYIKNFSPKYPISSMSTRSLAYGAAVFHIHSRKPWLLP